MTRERQPTDPLTRIAKLITTGRLMWIGAVIVAGGIGTAGVGALIGEGAARAGFEGRFVEHERRLTTTEMELAEARISRAAILAKLNNVEGMLAILVRGHASGGTP